jgi:pyruvate/2-oxoglutarate dehydrogenase complex dihydrolipoamide dehydrogenase (E3) component
MPYSGGLARNIEQCLNDFNIPLMLSHTVVDIHGKDRLTGVTIAKVDEKRAPIPGSEKYIECDTLLLSCGLIPENELTKDAGIALDRVTGGAVVDGDRQTEAEGIFACGNVLHVHDLVDFVSEESAIAGRAAAAFVNGKKECSADITLKADGKIRYTVPQRITVASDTTVYFRVSDVFRDKKIVVRCGDEVLLEKKKIKLAPAEMETVLIKKEMIEKIGSGEISLELV